jgi:folate-dependent phosphoribosylglycinamide formyltransferase PurN
MKRRVAVLISGRGSNMRSLLAACADAAFPAEIVQVLSNVPEAPGLAAAADAGIGSGATVLHTKPPCRPSCTGPGQRSCASPATGGC